jgi:hypothetical protein
MKQFMILLALLIVVPGGLIAQTPNGSSQTTATPPTSSKSETPQQIIKRMEGELNKAMLQGDAAALDRLLADDWTVKNPDTTEVAQPGSERVVRTSRAPTDNQNICQATGGLANRRDAFPSPLTIKAAT